MKKILSVLLILFASSSIADSKSLKQSLNDDAVENIEASTSIKTGKYSTLLQGSWESNNTGRRMFLLVKNGSEISRLEYKSETNGDTQFVWEGELDAEDIIRIAVWHNISSLGNLDFRSGNSTYFAIRKTN